MKKFNSDRQLELASELALLYTESLKLEKRQKEIEKRATEIVRVLERIT